MDPVVFGAHVIARIQRRGQPSSMQHVKLAGLAIAPIGKTIVGAALAEQRPTIAFDINMSGKEPERGPLSLDICSRRRLARQ